MKIVNLDLWLGMSSASNGARSFARIMLDFTITAVKKVYSTDGGFVRA
jgi:hypothetical protein